MSTPPFVNLPVGVLKERWPIRGSERAVLHAGLPGAASWIVMVPGFTGSKEDFIAVLPLLAEAGVGVIAFDQIGQFESDASDRPADYDIELLAADLAEIVDRAVDRFGLTSAPHVLGHSFGGLVAAQAVGSGVVRPGSYIALCTGPGALPPDCWGTLPALVDALDHADLASIWRIMRDQDQAADADRPAPDVAAFLEDRWHGNSPVQMRRFAGMLMTQPDLVARLRPVAAAGLPVTVIWGEHDDVWPIEIQARMASDLGAGAVELPGVGHSPNAEAPRVLVDALLSLWGGSGGARAGQA